MPGVNFQITMSLDGYVAGPNASLEDPLGEGGIALHEWAFATRAFREPHGREDGEAGVDDDVLRRSSERTGATIMGRRMYSGGSGPWEDDPNANGWWGDEPPFQTPVFVLTHHEREPLSLGETTFHFVTDGIESALTQAREAAGDRDVAIGGGADTGQQFLRAGLVDEATIHVVPLLLGRGVRLFENVEGVALDQVGVVEGNGVAHLTYRAAR